MEGVKGRFLPLQLNMMTLSLFTLLPILNLSAKQNLLCPKASRAFEYIDVERNISHFI